jgi:hypothetical protein
MGCMPARHFGWSVSMKRIPMLTTLLAVAGCAQTPCAQPDVLAFVDKAGQSRDLYAVGLTGDAVRETPIAFVPQPPGRAALDPHTAVCSAWMLSRNPAFQPGNGQARYLRQRQDFTVTRLASGYKVSLYRP